MSTVDFYSASPHPPLMRYMQSVFSEQRVRAEPGRQTVFGEFQAKNLASSSNDLQELFRK